MGIPYYIANTSKRQYFKPWELLSGDKLSALLNGLSGHALAVLIVDTAGASHSIRGMWSGDALWAVGDSFQKSAIHAACQNPDGREAWEILRDEYLDITPAIVAYLCEEQWLDEFLTSAEKDDCLYVNLANLHEQFDVKKLRFGFLERFGKDWRKRYNQIATSPSSTWREFWNLETVRHIVGCPRIEG